MFWFSTVEKFNTLTLIVDKASMGFPGGILVRIHLPMPEMWVWSLDGRSPGVGNCNTLQNSCQEIFIDRGVWWATIHGVTKSQTQLSTHVDQVCKRSARKSVTGTTLKTISKDGTRKNRNGMVLTEEDIKKRWQENTEELHKKDLHDPDNHDGVITHLEPGILEC